MAGVTALVRFGGTQEMVLYLVSFWITGGVLASCAGLRAEEISIRWVGLAVLGVGMVGMVIALPTLEARGFVAGYLSWGSLVSALFLCRGHVKTQRLILGVVILAGAGEALYGLVQAVGGVDRIGSYERHIGSIATGTFINRNHFAAFLNLSLASLIGMLYTGFAMRRRAARFEAEAWTWLIVLAGAGVGVAILLSQSRGGALTMIATLGLMTALLALSSRKLRRSALPARAGFLLLVAILALGSIVGVDALLARFGDMATSNRLPIYRDTTSLIGDHPWLGVGPGMYEWRFRPYQTAVLDKRFSHAHNDYLETAAEWGVPLAALLFGFLFWRTIRSGRVFLMSGDPLRRGVALGCTGAMASALAHSLVDFNLQIPAFSISFWAVVGVAWSAEESGRATTRGPAVRGSVRWAGLVLFKAALPALVILATIRVAPRWVATRIANAEPTISGLERAVGWDTENPRLQAKLARALKNTETAADLGRSIEAWKNALELNPNEWRYWNDLSRAFWSAELPEEEVRAMQRALELNPRDTRYQWRLAELYLRHQEVKLAVPLLGLALDGDPIRMKRAVKRLVAADASPAEIDAAWPRDTAARLSLMRLMIDRWEREPRRDTERFLPFLGFLDSEWDRMLAGQESPTVEEGLFYVRHLLEADRPGQARQRWLQLAIVHGISDPAFRAGRNRVWNGGFELQPTESPLDWRSSPIDGASIQSDADAGVDGSTALGIVFDGSRNLSFSNLLQYIVVEPATAYEVALSIRSDGLTTDEGLYLEISDAGSGRVLASSPTTLGTTSWTRVGAPFEVPAESATVVLTVRRRPSLRIDNKIAGTVWLDDVEIRAVRSAD